MSISQMPPSNSELDRRVTILETRFDTVLPTLATKADLQELRGELVGEFHALEARLFEAFSEQFKWLIGLFISLTIGLFGVTFTMWSAMERTIAQSNRVMEFAISKVQPATPSLGPAPKIQRER